jgi:protoporphyrinogen oxidase
MKARMMRQVPLAIVGAGFCGMGAGQACGAPVFDANAQPGGVCYSYYLDRNGRRVQEGATVDCFRFEPAGGHWLFDTSSRTLAAFNRLSPLQPHARKATIYFVDSDRLIPYPLQYHLRCLPFAQRRRILDEIATPAPHARLTLSFKDWLLHSFGPTLCELFFFPFNQRYTAGLYEQISPQDQYKTMLDVERVRAGAEIEQPETGYNMVFHYPTGGLNALATALAARCNLYLNQRLQRVDVRRKLLHFASGEAVRYERVLSSVPLNTMAALTDVDVSARPDPSSGVIVVNLGAIRGPRCPNCHWLYLPTSRSGVHRVGLYSEVDSSFLPTDRGREFVSLYAEKSFASGHAPTAAETAQLEAEVVHELRDWGFIEEALIVSSTVTDPAYTWHWIDSSWAEQTRRQLAAHGIMQIGRYGAWHFQGMGASFEEGQAAARRWIGPRV